MKNIRESKVAKFALGAFAVGACVSMLGAGPASASESVAAAKPTDSGLVAAPYADVTQASTNLMGLKAAGVNTISAAFASGPIPGTPGADPNTAYFGGTPAQNDYAVSQIQQYINAGGTVIPSFGGANADGGTDKGVYDLGVTASSAQAIQAAEQKVVDETKATTVDFDIESTYASMANTPAMQKEAQAMAGLQQANPGLKVTLTFAANPETSTAAVPPGSQDVAKEFMNAGVKVVRFNAMAMDYGQWYYDMPDGTNMELNAEKVAQGYFAYVKSLSDSQGLTDAQVWQRVGITQLIGAQDVDQIGPKYSTLADDPQFSISDATALRAFAVNKGLGELSVWSVTKDKSPADGTNFADWVPSRASSTWLGRSDGHPAQFPQFTFSRIFAGVQ